MQSEGIAVQRSWGSSCLGVARMEGAGKRQEEPGPAGGRTLCSWWDMLADFEQKRDMIHFVSSAPSSCCADEEGMGGGGWNCIQMHFVEATDLLRHWTQQEGGDKHGSEAFGLLSHSSDTFARPSLSSWYFLQITPANPTAVPWTSPTSVSGGLSKPSIISPHSLSPGFFPVPLCDLDTCFYIVL